MRARIRVANKSPSDSQVPNVGFPAARARFTGLVFMDLVSLRRVRGGSKQQCSRPCARVASPALSSRVFLAEFRLPRCPIPRESAKIGCGAHRSPKARRRDPSTLTDIVSPCAADRRLISTGFASVCCWPSPAAAGQGGQPNPPTHRKPTRRRASPRPSSGEPRPTNPHADAGSNSLRMRRTASTSSSTGRSNAADEHADDLGAPIAEGRGPAGHRAHERIGRSCRARRRRAGGRRAPMRPRPCQALQAVGDGPIPPGQAARRSAVRRFAGGASARRCPGDTCSAFWRECAGEHSALPPERARGSRPPWKCRWPTPPPGRVAARARRDRSTGQRRVAAAGVSSIPARSTTLMTVAAAPGGGRRGSARRRHAAGRIRRAHGTARRASKRSSSAA